MLLAPLGVEAETGKLSLLVAHMQQPQVNHWMSWGGNTHCPHLLGRPLNRRCNGSSMWMHYYPANSRRPHACPVAASFHLSLQRGSGEAVGYYPLIISFGLLWQAIIICLMGLPCMNAHLESKMVPCQWQPVAAAPVVKCYFSVFFRVFWLHLLCFVLVCQCRHVCRVDSSFFIALLCSTHCSRLWTEWS